MDTTPFTERQRIVKIRVVLILGLAVLVGSSTVTLAATKYKPGRPYCLCFCETGVDSDGITTGTVLEWEKVAHCSKVGDKCTASGKAGKLSACQECIGSPNGTKVQQCTKQAITGTINPFGQKETPLEGTPPPPPKKVDPFFQRAPQGIYHRGVEGEQPATAPTGEEGTTTAPK